MDTVQQKVSSGPQTYLNQFTKSLVQLALMNGEELHGKDIVNEKLLVSGAP